jgi:hypothetical protein
MANRHGGHGAGYRFVPATRQLSSSTAEATLVGPA